MLAAFEFDYQAAGFWLLTIVVGVFGWFIRQMHGDNKEELKKISAGLAPLAVIEERVTTLNGMVGDHARALPRIETDLAILSERQEHHGKQLDSMGTEIGRLREWKHAIRGEAAIQSRPHPQT